MSDITVMSGGGHFIERISIDEFESDTVVIDEFELWSLCFECGCRPSNADDALMSALTNVVERN